MTDIIERKTPEEIKKRIIESLNDKPLNAQEISKQIGSNWSTVREYVEQLVREAKVKEIIFGGSSIYQRITGDTYFNLPIKENERDTLKFIFSNAIKEYKELIGKPIRRTDLAKLTDYVNSELKLQLPIVWYIYGPMPLMIIDLQKDYSTNFVPKNAEEIKKNIKAWIRDKRKDKVREVIQECYNNSNEKLYKIKLSLFDKFEKNDYKGLYQTAKDFYLTYLASYNDDSKIVERIYEVVSGSDYLGILKEPKIKNKILLTLNDIWKYIASKALLKSLLVLGYEKESAELFMSPVIETKKYLSEESLKEIEEEYIERLPETSIQIKASETGKKVSEAMNKWLDSEAWRG